MVMSSAEHHLTHSTHITNRRVQFSSCTRFILMKSCTTLSLQDHALQVLNFHLLMILMVLLNGHLIPMPYPSFPPPISRPSHMFCSKAFICKLQQQTGLSNSSISNLCPTDEQKFNEACVIGIYWACRDLGCVWGSQVANFRTFLGMPISFPFCWVEDFAK